MAHPGPLLSWLVFSFQTDRHDMFDLGTDLICTPDSSFGRTFCSPCALGHMPEDAKSLPTIQMVSLNPRLDLTCSSVLAKHVHRNPRMLTVTSKLERLC
jgi:hypothetical protein